MIKFLGGVRKRCWYPNIRKYKQLQCNIEFEGEAEKNCFWWGWGDISINYNTGSLGVKNPHGEEQVGR